MQEIGFRVTNIHTGYSPRSQLIEEHKEDGCRSFTGWWPPLEEGT